MVVRLGMVGLTLGALVLTACGQGLTPPVDTDSDTTPIDGDSDTLPDRGTEGTDDPGTDGTDDPGTDDPGTDGTDACIPDCTGQVCGDDGCGGTCGTCADGSVCSDAGDECLTDSVACRFVELDDELIAVSDFQYGTTLDGVNFQMSAQFVSEETGTFSLDSGPNANFSTCEQCLLYFEDDGNTRFFPSAGAINIADNPTDGDVSFALAGVEMVESTIDDVTLVSTPVPGGECVEFASPLVLETAPPVVGECNGFTLNTAWNTASADFDGWFFASVDATPFAGEDVAEISLEFFSDATGVMDLASGDNANYATCSQCVTVFAQDEASGNARSFYATGGTINVTGGTPTGRTVTATISDLTLEEVTIEAGTFVSTPVADGQCIEGPASITIEVPAP